MSERLRNWLFTCFDLSDKFTEWTEDTKPEDVRYLVYQPERCPDTGREHLQGYIELSKSYRRSAVQGLLSNGRIHLEARQASREKARRYCLKDDTRTGPATELGVFERGQGSRSDLRTVATAITEGASTAAIALEHPTTWIRYHRGIESLAAVRDSREYAFRRVQVLVLWGDTGTGKTRAAFELLGGEPYVLALRSEGTLWFDGYRGQMGIIFDDFYGGIRHSNLLNLLDGHFLQLPVKGSFTYARWNRVVITSNTHPTGWYASMGYTPELKRRITKVIRLRNNLDFTKDLYEELKFEWTN